MSMRVSEAKAVTSSLEEDAPEETSDVVRTTERDTNGAATPGANDVERVQRLGRARSEILDEVRRVIVGQEVAIELLLTCVFAGGHGLFVGVPGLAKTLLIRTLASVLDLGFNRIQFTPDLMPSDITGTDVLEEDAVTGGRGFRFVPGPVFTNILLADEINRTPPKTQAALLQSMAEHQVTAGGRTHSLGAPYLVFATQNPIEQEGTYPLPEAQLDRFFMQIEIGYPSRDDEMEIVRRTTAPSEREPKRVLSRDEILELQALVPRVPVADHVVAHAVSLVRATRPEDPSCPGSIGALLAYGAGPRASQALILGAKTHAVLAGRYAAEIEDVRALVRPVLGHRLVRNFRAVSDGIEPNEILEDLLENVQP
jgi:MoxR-like ATPase